MILHRRRQIARQSAPRWRFGLVCVGKMDEMTRRRDSPPGSEMTLVTVCHPVEELADRQRPARPARPLSAGFVHGMSRVAVWTLAFAALAASEGTCAAQSPPTIDPKHEYNVKAVFLYSFGRCVEWPAASFARDGGAFVIGVVGDDPFGGALDRIAKTKRINGRPIKVVRFDAAEDIPPCHIAFVPKHVPAERQIAVAETLRETHVLLVGEVSGFAGRGGVINFYVSRGTVRFEVNVRAAKKRQLNVDAKLLALARIVEAS